MGEGGHNKDLLVSPTFCKGYAFEATVKIRVAFFSRQAAEVVPRVISSGVCPLTLHILPRGFRGLKAEMRSIAAQRGQFLGQEWSALDQELATDIPGKKSGDDRLVVPAVSG